MKRRTLIKGLAAGSVVMFSPMSFARAVKNSESTALEDGFLNPTGTAKPWVWWHWVDENVTKEGITKDLEWMSRIGIGGMQMFDTGFNVGHFVDEPVQFRSPLWYEMLHHAASEAKRLGLKMAMHSDSGSSVTGGTWVKPNEAMKKYVWSETFIQGPVNYKDKLTQPPSVNGGFQNMESMGGMSFGRQEENPEPDPTYYADSAVIAYRLPDKEERMADLSIKASCNGGKIEGVKLYDRNMMSSVSIPAATENAPAWIQYEFDKPFTSRALTIAGQSSFEIKISDDGSNFRNVYKLAGQTSRGFGRRSNATTTISFPEVSARYFRVEFPYQPPNPMSGRMPGMPGGMGQSSEISISELEFHFGGHVNRWEDKAYFGSLYDYETVPTPDVSANAIIEKTNITDLTEQMSSDGTLNWEVPEGKWAVMRLGYSLEGTKNHPAVHSAEGYECDKLSAKYVDSYIRQYLEPVKEALGDLYGTTFKYLLVDSWEAGAANWTDEMLQEFKARRGYDPTPYLPVLIGRIVENATVSDKFLWDYRRTISDMLANNHYEVIADYLHKDGLELYSEAAGLGKPTLEDGLQFKGKVDIPMGEFWMQYPNRVLRDEDEADIREAANAAHIYGKKIIAAESFTTAELIAWKQGPAFLKWGADYVMALGLNQFIIHTSVHQPLDRKPGMTLHVAGQHFSRNATWAEQAGPFIKYLTRGSYMLQQGKYVADFCYYYGESTPVTVPATHEIKPEPPTGYSYDFINTEVLLREMTVKNGRMVLPSGMSYKVLVLPPESELMTPEVIKKIQSLVEDGAIILGPKPKRSPSLKNYPVCDQEVDSIAYKLWGNLDNSQLTEKTYGKGKVFSGKTIKDILDAANIEPDFSYTAENNDAKLVWTHRRTDDADIYFMASQSGSEVKFDIDLRSEGKVPELWYIDSGKTELPGYSISEGRTNIQLTLDPFGSVFVVLREKALTSNRPAPVKTTDILGAINGSWNVAFTPDWGAPEKIKLDKLISWTEYPDEGVQHYSGTGTYTKEIQVPESWLRTEGRIILDLGDVKEIAEVKINGSEAGIAWKPPYQVDVTNTLKSGKNTLEIKVINLWLNRLIGDVQLPEEERYTFAFTLKTSDRAEEAYKNADLMDSGLLGPVRLLSTK